VRRYKLVSILLLIAFLVPLWSVSAQAHFSIFGWEFGSTKNKDEPAKDDDEQTATPKTLTDTETDATDDEELELSETPPPIEISPEGPVIQRVPWQKTDFGNQVGALGYDKNTFKVPEGFQDRVNFWISIYSKYTTNQGVLHDSVHPSIVYESVDFAPLSKDLSLSSVRRRHARERLIKDRKHAIEERLRRLQTLKSPEGLKDEDLRYWKMFEVDSSPTKFIDASKKGRLRFQLGQKDRFVLGIYYSGRYLSGMERIFREENLPIELTRLPFVESSFNIYARSRVGASGIWQFMRRTARPYMMVNSAVDERNDPLRATRSAAKLLRANYDLLQSWPLALTGWNHGPNGLLKIIHKTGTNDLVKIIQNFSSRRFGFASENFYACFLAALEVERNAPKYLGDVKWSVPLEHAEIHLSKPVPYEAVHVWFEGDDELAQLYNPHFSPRVRRGRQSMPRGTNVRIPKVMEPFALAYLQGTTSLQKMQDSIKLAKIKIVYPTAPSAVTAVPSSKPVASPVVPLAATLTPSPTPNPTPAPVASPAEPTVSPAPPVATATPTTVILPPPTESPTPAIIMTPPPTP
jgi:membrane-bound lytic murein transglycosylase D